MDTGGNINTETAGTYALLYDTLRAGNRGGVGGGEGGGYNQMYPGNSVLAAEAHANGTATKEAVDCNANRFNDGLARVSEQNKEQACNDRTMRINENITNAEFRAGDRDTLINKNLTDAEFRGLDRQRDIEKTLADMSAASAKCCCDTQKTIADAAKDAAKCCCDAKLQSCEDKAEILASAARDKSEILLAINAIKDRELNAANAKITQLETINALSNNHHGGH